MKRKLRYLIAIAVIAFSAAALFSCAFLNHEHTFSGEWTVKTPATTESEGEETNVCDGCGEEVSRTIPKHVHTFSADWEITTPASEESEGEKSRTCDVCGEAVTLPVTFCEEHTFTGEWAVTKKPTINSLGKETNTCDACGAKIDRELAKLVVKELKMTKAPSTTTYFTGEFFNHFGLEVTAILDNGTSIVIKNYTVLTQKALTAADKTAKIQYEDLTLEIPITVSKFAIGSVQNALDSEDGASFYIKALCVGASTASDGTKQVLLTDTRAKAYILLSGTNYSYEKGDQIEVYATVASDSYGKYLVYAEENGEGEKTLISKDNFVSSGTVNKTALGEEYVKELIENDLFRYDTVKFGSLFYVVKDGEDYIIHFNGEATDKSGAALTSGKYIKLSTANIDDSIITNRISSEAMSSYPGALVMGAISGIYLDSNSECLHFEILNKDWAYFDTYIEGQEYLCEVAYAFYHQLPYVDYDQYHQRRNINPTPEDANEQQRIYLDCSSYVNAVYYNAFGENILPFATTEKGPSTANFTNYAKENPDAPDVVGYWETADYETEEERAALLDTLYNELEVGDVIVYRKASSGHALIYVGGGKILHCMNTNSFFRHPDKDKTSNPTVDPLLSYDWVSSSSVGFESTENLFKSKSATRYLFSPGYTSFTILRPMNRNLSATEQTKARMTIPGLSIEKLASSNMFAAVFTGDEITYTVTLKNNNVFPINDVTLLERVPLGTEFVLASEGVTHSEGAISWTGSVEAGKTVTLSFTVKVTATAPGTLIESNVGTVNGLALNKIINTVSGISKEKLESLSEIGYTKAENQTEYFDPILMIKEIYKELLGKDIFDYQTVEEALTDIINVTDKKYNEDCAIDSTVMKNFIGGYLIQAFNRTSNERIRAIRIEYLTVGDVIIAEHVSTENVQIYTAYIYLGGSDFLAITSDVGTASVTVCKEPDLKKIQNILASLYSYNRYAIIRPSMDNSAE